MGYLHRKTKDKKGNSLLHEVFQGEVQVPENTTEMARKMKGKYGKVRMKRWNFGVAGLAYFQKSIPFSPQSFNFLTHFRSMFACILCFFSS